MTFNDKVHYRRLRVRDPVLQTFSDKLSMRDYVSERLGPESVPTLLAVAEHPSQLSTLMGPYVLKPSHASGLVTFIADGARVSADQRRVAESWLGIDFEWADREWGYRGARRLLLAEEFLHDPGSLDPPRDYKFFTFDGKVEMIQVDSDRFSGHRRMLRRADWSPIAGTLGPHPRPDNADEEPPPHLGLMLEWSARLGEGLDFVRVDLYDVNGRVLVGELTLYPNGGNERFRPADLDAWLGGLWRGRPVSHWPTRSPRDRVFLELKRSSANGVANSADGR